MGIFTFLFENKEKKQRIMNTHEKLTRDNAYNGCLVILSPEHWDYGSGPGNPKETTGRLYCIDGTEDDTVRVDWGNGYRNVYKFEDLLIANLSAESEPLTQFAGYGLTGTPNTVLFGCGDVTVQRKDLRIVASAFDDPSYKEAVKKLVGKLDKAGMQLAALRDLDMTPEDIAAVMAELKKEDSPLSALSRLEEDTEGHYEVTQIINIHPPILCQIASVPIGRSEDDEGSETWY